MAFCSRASSWIRLRPLPLPPCWQMDLLWARTSGEPGDLAGEFAVHTQLVDRHRLEDQTGSFRRLAGHAVPVRRRRLDHWGPAR